MKETEADLFVLADLVKGVSLGQTYKCPPKCCDQCGRSLEHFSIFIDGRLKGDSMWGIMCADCFKSQGEGIGYGKGQLYLRQGNGGWLLVAGFPPEYRG